MTLHSSRLCKSSLRCTSFHDRVCHTCRGCSAVSENDSISSRNQLIGYRALGSGIPHTCGAHQSPLATDLRGARTRPLPARIYTTRNVRRQGPMSEPRIPPPSVSSEDLQTRRFCTPQSRRPLLVRQLISASQPPRRNGYGHSFHHLGVSWISMQSSLLDGNVTFAYSCSWR